MKGFPADICMWALRLCLGFYVALRLRLRAGLRHKEGTFVDRSPALILGAADAASAEIVPGYCQSSSCAGLLFR
jgi:hypothetical protein